ncbi:hypothetical protein ACOME3_002752 [Neoechinorhynchus agilis]
MKHRRRKIVKRSLVFYRHHFGLSKPYTVLVDGTFCQAALKDQINIKEQLIAHLSDNQVNVETTQCAIKELEMLDKMPGTKGIYGALCILRQFKQSNLCAHSPALPTENCFKNILENAQCSLFVATQSASLKELVRYNLPGNPIILITHRSVNVEAPSKATKALADAQTRKKVRDQLDAEKMDVLKELERSKKNDLRMVGYKRKAKGPNPLSCLKRKEERLAKKRRRGKSKRSILNSE